jgi:hypothetical protein
LSTPYKRVVVRRNIVESFTSAVRNSLFGLTLQRCGAPFPGSPKPSAATARR